MTLGEKIRKIRAERHLTQKELADRCGMADSAIRKYESGKITPKAATLKKIASALDVSMFDLMELGAEIPITIPGVEYPTRMIGKAEYEKMSAAEKEDYDLRLLADMSPDTLKEKLIKGYDGLNKLGKVEAVKRTLELAECKKYTESDNNSDISFTLKITED